MPKTVLIDAAYPETDTPMELARVMVTLVAGSTGGVVGSTVVAAPSIVTLDSDGHGEIELPTNDTGVTSPTETFYRFTVLGSSPTISRSIRLTDDLPDEVSWTEPGILVEDPDEPVVSRSSDFVLVGDQSLTNYLADLGNAVPVDLLFAVSEVDGTNTSWDFVVPSPGATATGNVPADWASTGHLDGTGAELAAFLWSELDPDTTITVAVPGGSAVGIWQFTPATIQNPWTAVTATAAYAEPTAGNGLAAVWAGEFDGTRWFTLLPHVHNHDDRYTPGVLADLRAEAVAHALTYADTEAAFFICGTSDEASHADRAWLTDPLGPFATGFWHEALVWIEPFYRDGAYDGELVFSEDGTETHDMGNGSWDNFERAVMRVWSEAEHRWYSWPYYEATLLGGTEERIRVFPNRDVSLGEFGYDVDLFTGWWLPEGQWMRRACWCEFTGGPDGVWRHREFIEAIATTPDVVLAGRGWRTIYDCHGTEPGSIDTPSEPWSFGLDKGALRMAWMVIGDGPDGTVFANPTAAAALEADPAGVSPFTDEAGNEWTPGENASARSLATGGGGLDETAVQALIDASVAALLDGAPGALDTLNELAAALGDDASFAASVTTALAGKASTSHNHAGVYQPADADLDAIAALTTTTFGRALLELANAAALRSAAQLGSLATLSAIPNNGVRHHAIPSFGFDVASGASTWNADVNCSVGGGFLSGEALNDYIEFTEWLDAGTWTLDYWYVAGTTGGVATLTLDGGSAIGSTIDAYNGSTTRNNRATRTGITVATSGLHTLRIAMLSKNASSSSYRSGCQAIHWRRTA